jgi:hypothetical protein
MTNSKMIHDALRAVARLSLIGILTCGCSQEDNAPIVIARTPEKEPAEHAREMLESFFKHREIDVKWEGEWLVLTEYPLFKARVAIRSVEEPQGDGLYSVTVDGEFELSSEQTTKESFVDPGTSKTLAVMGAMMEFQGSTLETICRAYKLGKLQREEPKLREIAGKKRKVYGSLQVDGAVIGDYESIAPLTEALMRKVESSSIESGTHWIRFDVICGTEDVVYAVWLDNEPWEEAMEAVGAVGFPKFEGETYGFTYFLMIRDAE